VKIPEREKQPLVKAKAKAKQPRKKSDFTLACEAAGHHPETIRNRLRKDPDLTLEEALAQPVMSPSEVGRLAAGSGYSKVIRASVDEARARKRRTRK